MTTKNNLGLFLKSINFENSTMCKVLSEILIEKKFDFNEKLFEDS